ncbi:MAG: hypothetical protein KJ000_02365 [Pirellulaceae bacterium]|nr:hypothetical protein [Pirellulaceae bacterium]
MQIRKFATFGVAALLAALLLVPSASAQPGGRGGPGGFGGGFGGGGLLGLLRVEAVQKEIEALPDQLEAVQKLEEQLRADRPTERPDFRNMSEEDREKAFAEMRERATKQAATAKAKLAEILLPPQMTRLEQIALQQRGIQALSDDDVAAKLGISAAQKEKIASVSEENRAGMRERMQAIMQGGNRETMRDEFAKLRKESDDKVLAVLTSAQKAKFEEMKGEAFEMPAQTFGGRGGQPGAGGQPGGRGGQPGARGGQPGGRGQRGARPQN